MSQDLLIGIDAGTSWLKAVAFDVSGKQIDSAAVRNNYRISADGAAEQSMQSTWDDCIEVLRLLGQKVDNFPARVSVISLTGQGDGTWLVDKNNQPIGDAWLWLDARAGALAERLRNDPDDEIRFARTGTGITCCQMGAQLRYMKEHLPQVLEGADASLHCKDWLYLNLTGVRASDPSEALFSFGSYLTGQYDEDVITILGLADQRHLFPDIIDGTKKYHPLSDAAAAATGLREGTPVVLGYVDIVCSALGSGAWTGEKIVGSSIVGSTGVHIKAMPVGDIQLNTERTGYVMAMPVPGIAAQLQTNMAATLNLDWLLKLANELLGEFGREVDHSDLVARIDGWLAQSTPGSVMYHPYISEAGERGPFVDSNASASFLGLTSQNGFADLMMAVVDSLGLAARDCYAAMGGAPSEVRLSGGGAKSKALRRIFASSLNTNIRHSERDEAGAAGAAMIGAVSVGAYPDMESCIRDWVTPYLTTLEEPDDKLVSTYEQLFGVYHSTRQALPESWVALRQMRAVNHG